MRFFFAFLAVSIAALTAGCASEPNYPAPPMAGSLVFSDAPIPLNQTLEHTARLGESQIFLSQTEGGGVVAGLLGGALLNSYLVSKHTEGMANSLSSSPSLEVASKVKGMLQKKMPMVQPGTQPVFSVSSAIFISVDLDKKVRAELMVNAGDTSSLSSWSKSYFYHFASVMDAEGFKNGGYSVMLNDIALELDRSIDITTSVLADDLQGRLGAGSPIVIHSDFISPLGVIVIKFNGLRLADHEGMVVVRIDGKPTIRMFPNADGVHIFRTDQYSIVN